MNSTFALYVPLSHHFIGRTRLLSSYTHFSPITTFVNLLPNVCIYYFVSERPPWTHFVNCNVYTQWASEWPTEKKINTGHLCCPSGIRDNSDLIFTDCILCYLPYCMMSTINMSKIMYVSSFKLRLYNIIC